ncbi:MAG TPA: glycosyltransferase family 4 protein [archaeon]|nr:glycosyltransferase family 4 protein [archaeon]
MNIVQISNHFSPCIGGVERVVEDICTYFSSKKHKIEVICLDRCAYSSKPLLPTQKLGNIFVRRIPFLDLKYYKIAPGVLGRIFDADILHVHGIGFFSDLLILTKPFHKKNVVVSTHGGIFHTKNIGFIKNLYFFWIQKLILPHASKVIAVSNNDYELFRKISNNVVLIENGVEISAFKQGKKLKNSFLFVGRFAKNKRVEKLLEAFAQLEEKDFTLIIAGTDWGNLLDFYKRKAKELGIGGFVKFAQNPLRDELGALYSSSEYFVSASEYEGFGISLVEAMACGCIPIVRRNEGFANIITEGVNGLFCDFEKPKIAAGNIKSALDMNSSQKKSLSKNAQLRSKDFSWGEKFKMLEKIYSGGRN